MEGGVRISLERYEEEGESEDFFHRKIGHYYQIPYHGHSLETGNA